MPSLLNRYLFFQILATSLSLGIVLIAAIWILQSLRFVELVLSTKSSLWMFGKLALLSLPDLCALILPISVFISALVVLNRLITEREFAVMQSVGVSRYKLMSPFLKFAGAVMVVLYIINLFVSPFSQAQLKKLQHTLKNALPAVLIQEGVFNEFGNMIIYVRGKRANYLKGVFVSNIDKKDNSRVIITAQEGHLITDEKTPKILLFNGTRQTTNPKTKQVSSLFFKETIVSLQKDDKGAHTTGMRPQEMPFLKLLFPGNGFSKKEKQRMRAEAHQKITTPLLVLVFMLVAGVFMTSGQFSRRGNTRKIITAVLGVVGIQGLVLFLINQSAKFPPAIFLNYLLLFCLFGGLLLFLIDKKNLTHYKKIKAL